MVCRMWRGWAAGANAPLYDRYLKEDLFPRLAATIAGQGYRGYQILTRPVGEETEFTTLVWFDSLASIRAFSGEGFERAVVTEKAAALLSRWEPLASHHDLSGASAGLP